MANRLIVDLIYDWIRDQKLREGVLHKEETNMNAYGLEDKQIKILRKFKLEEIAGRICEELGVDLDDLRQAIYGPDSAAGAAGAAAYDEGKTHIRRVVPKVAPNGTQTTFVLWGHGFKADNTKITVEFVTGPPNNPVIVQGTVTAVECGVDVWQRVTVTATLNQTGDWAVRAHNDDDIDASKQVIWSDPSGMVHVV
jgi:hypothetical protein